jgi:thiamine biosynthesis lipoprotein
VAEAMVEELDRVASRFGADSEISGITAATEDADVQVVVSELLGGCLEAALHAADITDGLVDPTVGRAVAYDPVTQTLILLRGTVLDFGATAKAHAADLIAARLGRELRGGFLVNLGGDIAVSGLLPIGGWDIGVEDENGVVRQVVVSSGQAVATSSTRRRIWTAAGERRHHIVDPRTGRTAAAAWSQVTCAGVSALEANAASTAAVVLGAEAPEWLEGHGVPARLDAAVGRPVVTPGGPNPERRAA